MRLIWVMEVTQNTFCAKDEGMVDPRTVTRRLKKLCSGCRYQDNQAKSGRYNTMDSEAMFQANEANPVYRNYRSVSGEFGISKSKLVCYFLNLDKRISCCQSLFHVTKMLQNLWLTPKCLEKRHKGYIPVFFYNLFIFFF